MADIRTFNSYNFVTGAVDGTLAYDFTNPAYYPDEETVHQPRRRTQRRSTRQERLREREWIKEDVRTESRAETAAHDRQGISLLSLMGVAAVIVLLTMMLLAQIRLTDISSHAAELETRIAQLELEKDKLTVEYETIFNLKSVEEYAVNTLGMQQPEDDQIFYLTGVTSADRAVVITRDETDMFGLGLEDLTASLQAFMDKLSKAYSD